MAESGQLDGGLRYDSECRDALDLAYVLSVRNMDEEQKREFDGWCSASLEEMAAWADEQKEHRRRMILSVGEVAGH